MGIEFFLKGIPLMKPRIYKHGELKRKPVIAYSHAEWTILARRPWLMKGLGGICGNKAASLKLRQWMHHNTLWTL